MRELKWLESLAPKPPPVDADQRGNLQLLEIIQENTEYPFWSAAKESPVAPAHGITLCEESRVERWRGGLGEA
jgi:hypothetical protein